MANEIATIDNAATESVENLYEVIDRLGGRAGIVFTGEMNTPADRLAVLGHVSNSESIQEHLDEVLNVTDIVIQAVDMADERTGVLATVPRLVFVTADGKSIHAISKPLFRDVRTLLGLADLTEFPGGVPLRVVKEGKAPNAYYTIKYGDK